MTLNKAAGADPKFKELPASTDPLAFVISANLARRHLSESQRAMIAERIATMPHGGDRKSDQALKLAVDQTTASKMLNVGASSIRKARKVRAESPDLAEKVERGEMTLNKAAGADPKFKELPASASALHQVPGRNESSLFHEWPAVGTFPE